jgi:hypothetical protein
VREETQRDSSGWPEGNVLVMNDQPRLRRASALVPLATDGAGVEAHRHEDAAALRAWCRRLGTSAAILGLCLLSAAFFWKILVLHWVLLPGDILYAHDPLWQALSPHSFTVPANPLDSDALTEFYPWTVLATQALHRGQLPLWNPYAFAGTPFLAAMQTGLLYPLNLLLEWLLPPVDVLGLRAVLHLAAILVGTFLFARCLGLSRGAALLSAIAFGLSLPDVVWLEHPIAGAIAWLPWILLCTDRVMATRGSRRWLVGAATALALDVLAGHGESTAHVLLLWSAYVLLWVLLLRRGANDPGAVARPVLALVAALLLALGIAAAYLLPTLAQVPLSEAAADRALVAPVGPLGSPALWTRLVVAVIPDFFGNPTWHVTLLPLSLGYNELALYTGTVPLLLAILALLQRRDAHTVFFAAVAVVALGAAVHLPVLALVNDLPVLRVAANGRLRLEYAFAVAILAGYGLDALVCQGRSVVAWRVARTYGLGVLVLAALAVWGLLHARAGSSQLPLATAARAGLPVAWLGLFVGLLWLQRRGALGRAALGWGTLVLVVVDLFTLGVEYHATVPRAPTVVAPPAVRVVLRDRSLYRVAGLGMALLPALSSLYGLQDVRGYDPAYSAAYEHFFSQSFATPPGMRLALAPFGPSPKAARALALLNVKYIFAPCSVPLNRRFYRLMYAGAGCVYRASAALPRAVLVHSARWATPERATALLGRGSVDPRHIVLLDPATASGAAWRLASAPHRSIRDEVRVRDYDLDAVTVDVRSARDGVLVLADAYARGWQAAIDGRPAPLARADAAFRAVPVGPGAHTVRFTYRPQTFSVGVAVSALACAVWLVLLLGRQLSAISRRRTDR